MVGAVEGGQRRRFFLAKGTSKSKELVGKESRRVRTTLQETLLKGKSPTWI